MCCSLSLCETCQTYVLRVQIWVWNLQLPPVLLLCPWGFVSGAPKCTGWESGHPSRRGCLFSVEIQTVPIVLETIKRIQEVDRSLYGTSFTLWAFLERCNGCLGIDTDSWLENLSFGEAPTFGDEWLKHETRRKREHKIALLPTGSQAVTMSEPDWDCDMAKEMWDQKHFSRCILERLKQAHTKTLNYAKLADIEQGEKETPDKFLDRL